MSYRIYHPYGYFDLKYFDTKKQCEVFLKRRGYKKRGKKYQRGEISATVYREDFI